MTATKPTWIQRPSTARPRPSSNRHARTQSTDRSLPALLTITLLLFAHGSLAAPTTPNNSQKNTTPALQWVGDWDSYYAYMHTIAKAYQQATGTAIELKPRGTSKGIRAVFSGQADLGGAGRYRLQGLPEEDRVEMLPVAWDPLVVIVNADNPISNITQKQLRQIYHGDIHSWTDLGTANGDIKLYYRQDDLSGVGYTLRKLLFADTSAEFTHGTAVKAETDIATKIAQDQAGIAVVGYASAMHAEAEGPVKIVAIDGLAPSQENIIKGRYLYYRVLYMVTNPSHKRRKELLKLRRFVQSPAAQQLLIDNKGIPFLKAPQLKLKELQQDRDAHTRGF